MSSSEKNTRARESKQRWAYKRHVVELGVEAVDDAGDPGAELEGGLEVRDLADELERRAALHLQPRHELAVDDKLHALVLHAHQVAVHVEVDKPAGGCAGG